ncbi:MAG: MFS transporter [Alphaproteobacteria bacterium GM202ARS2]|nr:MFS transporter [Alphaproteobacteria bacterium GM202ARS2]
MTLSAVHSGAPNRRSNLLRYSLLAFPLTCAGLPIYVHAPALYATELGVSLTTIGLLLLILRIVDAVQDPWIGSLSDRWHAQRHWVMAVGIGLLGGGFWMVFHPLIATPVVWFGVAILLCTTGFSIVSINVQALGGLWRASTLERTRITSWREAIGLLGLLWASITPTLLGSEKEALSAFHLFALMYLPILAVCGWVFFGWMRIATLNEPDTYVGGGGGGVSVSLRRLATPWHRRFFGIYLCNTFASAIPAVLVLFFIRDRLQASDIAGVFLLLYFLSGAAAMPLWQLLARRLGKQQAWMVSMVLAAVTFVWAFTFVAGDVVAYAVVCVLSGLALGADLALPPSIVADKINEHNDEALAARYFSVMTFLSKAALALATGVTLPMLGLLGYQPGAVADYSVTEPLSYAYALIPSILKASVALWLWRFGRATKIAL